MCNNYGDFCETWAFRGEYKGQLKIHGGHLRVYDVLGVTLFILEEKNLEAKKNLGSDHRMIPYHIYVPISCISPQE
jgi:hypothetical protein